MPKKNTKSGLTAEQLPSGSWRVRTHGRAFTSPDKKEAMEKALAFKAQVEAGKNVYTGNKTLGELVADYIAAQTRTKDSKGLSPTTIRNYKGYHNNMFTDLQAMRPYNITLTIAQASVRHEAVEHSPKYIKNAWNMLHRAADYYGAELPRVRLPEVQAKELSWVAKADMSAFLKAIEEDEPQCEIAYLLALHSLRRSEMFGLRWQDIDYDRGNMGALRICGTRVQGPDGWEYKEETKNSTSRRVVPIVMPRLTELLKAEAKRSKSKYVITWGPTGLQNHLNKACERAGIKRVTLHDLRRTFASVSYDVMDEQTIMKMGGWSDIYTMRKNYTRMNEQELFEKTSALVSIYTKKDESRDKSRDK